MRKFFRDNGLSIVLLAAFVAMIVGQSVAGYRVDANDRREHGLPPQSYAAYVTGPEFLSPVAENWESEFLQMGVYAVLTAMLFQKGSAESKDPDEDEAVDREPDPNRPGAPGPVRRGGVALALYRHSLSIALFGMFAGSLVMHAAAGARAYNAEQAEHGSPDRTGALGYLATSDFWFESLQNWQSEFLSIGVLVLLTVWLREHGSPQSKPVDASHEETGAG